MSDLSTISIRHNDDWLRSRLKKPDNLIIKRPIKSVKRGYISDISIRRNNLRQQSPRPIFNNYSKKIVTKNNLPLITKATNQPTRTKPTFSINRTNRSRVLKRNQFHVIPPVSKIKKKEKPVLPTIMMTLAVVMFSIGVYSDLSSLKNAHASQLQAASLTKIANKVANTVNVASATNQPTSNTKNPVPSSLKPSNYSIANYMVAPSLPRYIIIPSLGVKARVLSVGVTTSGALQTPDNVYDTAWYNESSLPGQPGAMLIDGHVSSWTAHGVFYGIKNLKAGDVISIQRGDGTIFNYKVVKNQVYPSGNVNMTSAMTPVVAGQPGLNLITCTGDVIPGTSQFNERIVVYATLQS